MSQQLILRIFRIILPAFILVHGLFRAFGGFVDEFGGFLDSRGFVIGVAIAWVVTVMEIAGSLLIMSGFFVRILATYFVCELAMGIVLVHMENGWFVVGGGRNGVEYSVLLILGYLMLATFPRNGRPATSP